MAEENQSTKPTPPANRAAAREKEEEGEGYRDRGRRAISGETAPLKDMADDAAELIDDERPQRPGQG